MRCSRSAARSGERMPCEGEVFMAITETYRARIGAAHPSDRAFTVLLTMHQGALIEDDFSSAPKAFARELADGQTIDSVFVVRDRTLRESRKGDSFVKLRLSDVTGTVEAVAWDDVGACHDVAVPGRVVRV